MKMDYRICPTGGTKKMTGIIFFACILFGFAISCDSEYNVHDAAEETSDPAADEDGEDISADEDIPEDIEEDAALPAEESCAGENGVTVEGTVFYEGVYPIESRLWVAWHLDPPRIPQCMLEIDPVVFPAPFKFTDVPDEGWHIEVCLDVSGDFPPIPAEGDYVATISEAELNLSGDISGLEIYLQPYTP